LTKKDEILLGQIENEIDLLHRHVNLLNVIIERQPIGITRLAELTKIPNHKVRYSLRILEKVGLIEPSPTGAIATQKSKVFISNLKKFLIRVNQRIEKLEKTLKPR
jgi:predicted transcriptional regulator